MTIWQAWAAFWAFVVFGSIAWYAFLLVYIGLRAGREIRVLMETHDPRRDDA